MQLENNTAFITGAGSGLGEATATLLRDSGANVVLFDRDITAAQRVADQLGGLACGGDVTDTNDIERSLASAVAQFGDIRFAINCAGVGGASRIVGRNGPMALADFNHIIQVNLIGTFNVMRILASHMMTLKALTDGARGAIVNTSSLASQDGQLGQAAYAASKGGINSLALPAAREFSSYGIRVNTIAPGIFQTPLLKELAPEAQAQLAADIPFPTRLGKPEEFASTVKFVLENDYINAELIRVDGALRLAPKSK